MKIGVLGPEGTFSHQAALTLKDATLVFAHSISDVFDLYEQGIVDYALVPLENSVSGTIAVTLDHLQTCRGQIVGEVVLPIVHHLGSFTDLQSVEKIFSHPHTFEQCRNNLQKLFVKQQSLEKIEVIYTNSNALSAQELLEHKAQAAALIPEYLVNKYEVPLLKESVQDESSNETRFVLIGEKKTSSTGHDRSSIIFFPKENRLGVLAELISILSECNLNLTKLESKPNRKKLGEYFFYMDFEGHIEDNEVQKALEQAQKIAPYRFLGSYPRQF